MLRSGRVLALVFLMSCAGSALAANPVAEQWMRQLDESSDALKRGDPARSLKIANRLIRDMMEKLGPGDGAMRIFGTAVTHKALAHAGLGQKDDALWYWHVVLGLYPSFAESDLTMFGEAGKFLAENRKVREKTEVKDPKPLKPNSTPPKVRKRVEPKWPRGAHYFGTSGRIVLEMIITKEGTVTAPRIESALPAPTLSYSALEAVRQWRFEPGKIDGEPVDVIFNLTINFKL